MRTNIKKSKKELNAPLIMQLRLYRNTGERVITLVGTVGGGYSVWLAPTPDDGILYTHNGKKKLLAGIVVDMNSPQIFKIYELDRLKRNTPSRSRRRDVSKGSK